MADVGDQIRCVPRGVERGIDEERAAFNVPEQQVMSAGAELAGREAHRDAAGAAARRPHEHDRAAPGGAQALDRLARRRGCRDPGFPCDHIAP